MSKTTLVDLCSTTLVGRLIRRGWGIHRLLDGALAMFFCSSRQVNCNYVFSRIVIREYETTKCLVSRMEVQS